MTESREQSAEDDADLHPQLSSKPAKVQYTGILVHILRAMYKSREHSLLILSNIAI